MDFIGNCLENMTRYVRLVKGFYVWLPHSNNGCVVVDYSNNLLPENKVSLSFGNVVIQLGSENIKKTPS